VRPVPVAKRSAATDRASKHEPQINAEYQATMTVRCKLCGAPGPLVRAHVTPRSFYELSTGPLYVLTNASGKFTRRSQTGEYDTELVCAACEARFAPWDTYGHDLLIRSRDTAPPILDGKTTLAWSFKSFDYVKLKLFFLSVLWRAAVSNRDFFAHVDIGPHEDTLRNTILHGDPGDPEFYSVIVARFPAAAGLLNPHRERWEGINFYRLYMREYMVLVKVDSRPTPEPWSSFTLGATPNLIVIARDLRRSPELPLLRRLVSQRSVS
jgi:hypothetical protein